MIVLRRRPQVLSFHILPFYAVVSGSAPPGAGKESANVNPPLHCAPPPNSCQVSVLSSFSEDKVVCGPPSWLDYQLPSHGLPRCPPSFVNNLGAPLPPSCTPPLLLSGHADYCSHVPDPDLAAPYVAFPGYVFPGRAFFSLLFDSPLLMSDKKMAREPSWLGRPFAVPTSLLFHIPDPFDEYLHFSPPFDMEFYDEQRGILP